MSTGTANMQADPATRPLTDREWIEKRFKYHPPKDGQVEKFIAIREKAKELALLVVDSTPRYGSERDKSLVCIEEAVMWANACIARQ